MPVFSCTAFFTSSILADFSTSNSTIFPVKFLGESVAYRERSGTLTFINILAAAYKTTFFREMTK